MRCVFMTANPQTCPKCGSPVTPGMKFCESCGEKIEALPVCPQCGAALAPNVKFCETCGAPVSLAAAPVKTAKEVAVPVAATVSPVHETTPIQEALPPAEPPVKATPAEAAPVAAAVAATVSPAPESAPVKEVKPPAEPLVKAEKKPVTVPEEKPAPAPVNVKEPPKTEKVKEVPKETVPKQPGSSKTMIIAGVIILAVLGAAVYFVGLPLLSGSGTPTQNPPVSPVTTNPGSSSETVVTAAVTSQTGTVSFTPGPTQVPPSNLGLIIDVERDAITHIITVTFQGGAGQYGVRELVVTLTKSDGTVERKSFKPENRGSFITLMGTEKTDRVEITANYYNGESFKVVDQIFEYKKRTGSP
jgi:outer membrane biosynthesis protein TonB